MNAPYVSPKFELDAFNCPHCGAHSNQLWYNVFISDDFVQNYGDGNLAVLCYDYNRIQKMKVAICNRCKKPSFWFAPDTMFYPNGGTSILPSNDMPSDVKQDYLEARSIMHLSPRGASALLRLAIQKLCKHLGGNGDNINSDIALLVQGGLPVKLQQALDSVRVIGNNAVHPGQIDLIDDVDTVEKLFSLINIICDNQITQPKLIDQFYQEKIPQNLKDAIDKRDGSK